MTILNINKFYYVRGGSERFFFELQAFLESKGHRVVPFAMQHEDNFTTEYGKYFVSEVETERISLGLEGLRTVGRYMWSWSARAKLRRLIDEVEPELAILHNIYHQISPSILPVLSKCGITVMLVAHDYGLLSPNHFMFVRGKIYDRICGDGWLRCIPDRCVRDSVLASLVCGLETWLHHSVLDVYRKNIDHVICPSAFMYRKFAEAGWPESKLVHLPYFIKPSDGEAGAAGAGDSRYILYFGRLSEEKGVEVLLEALRDLPEVRLKIAGTGPEEATLRARISHDRLAGIELVGYRKGRELSGLISQAEFIVVPSVWYENYPLSILEAYDLGVPALLSNIGGLPEMAAGDDFLFKPGDAKDLANRIRFLWKNPDVLKGAKEGVRSYIKTHNDPEAYYRALMQLHASGLPVSPAGEAG
jgi:glycosyltransferase involved in cell wall biosynthesis